VTEGTKVVELEKSERESRGKGLIIRRCGVFQSSKLVAASSASSANAQLGLDGNTCSQDL
jgi:hypothetical protein